MSPHIHLPISAINDVPTRTNANLHACETTSIVDPSHTSRRRAINYDIWSYQASISYYQFKLSLVIIYIFSQ
jgi:hypothetical protein